MNLLQIDIQQSKLIPFVAISLLMTHLTVSFFDMEMFMASYAALAGMLLAFFGSLVLLGRQRTLHLYDFLVLLFVFTLEGITLLNGTDWKNGLYLTLSISAYIFLFNYYQEQYYTLILGILFVLSVAIYCQVFQCIAHPEMWLIEETKQNYGFILGGNYNQMGSRLMIALTAGIISVRYSKWFWMNLVPLFLCCFTILFMVKSMTALSCLFLFLLFFLIQNKRLLSFGATCVYVGVILFQGIVCFSGTGLENNDLARWFIVDVLEKDMTFTGRTEMWDSAIRVIVGSPLWGYGFVDSDWFNTHMSNRAIGAHNFILNTMVYGGIILLALYFAIILKSIGNLIRINDIYSIKMIAAFGVMSIMMLFEAYETPLVFLLLTIMYYYPGQESPESLNPNAKEQ
jgi:O-antigen ligase